MVEPIELDVSTMKARRGAAMLYLAYVCYPNDDASRQKFIASVAAQHLKFLRDEHGIYVPYPVAVLRVEVPTRTCRRQLKKAHNILIEKRIPIARDIACAVAAKRIGLPIASAAPTSIIDAIEDYAWECGRDGDNIRQREWYPTKPVAHLTLGLLATIDWDQYQTLSLMELMLGPDPEWVPEAIRASQLLLEQLIRAQVISDDGSAVVICAKNSL